jgi:hypothetical protein
MQLTEAIRTTLLIINTTNNGPNSNKELQGLPAQTPVVQPLLHLHLLVTHRHHRPLELDQVHLHRRLPLVVEATML